MERKDVTYTAEDIEALLKSGALTRLGMGTRRVCYALPGGTFCMKCYRSDDEIAEGINNYGGEIKPLRSSVVREIRRNRFSEKKNTSCIEWRYHQEILATMPKKIKEVFPEHVERICLPTYGWCLVETAIVNFDGTTARPVVDELIRLSSQTKSPACIAKAGELLKALPSFFDMLADATVRFYDPPNVIVQWIGPESFRLRIADFEPKARTVIALDRWFDFCARFKCRRRSRRFLRSLWPAIASLKDCMKDVNKV